MLLSLKIPAINKTGYPEKDHKGILQTMDAIEKNYGSYISQAANLSNVPRKLIISFIFIESAGKKDVLSFICNSNSPEKCPVGLMQLTPETATNVIYIENKNKRLSAAEKKLLYSLLGKEKTDCILSMQYMNQKLKCNDNTGVSITVDELKNPQLNIFLGTMLIGQYIDQYSENGKLRLDKVIIAYNKSPNTAKKAGASIEEAVQNLPEETSRYIYKLLGIGGTLHLLS